VQVAHQSVKSEIGFRQSGQNNWFYHERILVNWYNNIGAVERNTRNQDVKMKSWFEKKKKRH
jgi:TRAP-type mannitol/chloroaromatic compound transport system substrate-binding protein